VIIDVFRAFTTAAFAIAAGAREVILVADHELAITFPARSIQERAGIVGGRGRDQRGGADRTQVARRLGTSGEGAGAVHDQLVVAHLLDENLDRIVGRVGSDIEP